jgi:hypothetical protein
MATYYVDSNATGLNDGSSWTDAWTSITSSTSVSAGDIVLVASDHSETSTTTFYIRYANGTSTNPIQVISTNKLTSAYEAGAELLAENTNQDMYAGGYVRYCGLTLKQDRYSYLTSIQGDTVFDDCNISHTATSAASGRGFYLGTNSVTRSRVSFIGCVFDFLANGNTNSYLIVARDLSEINFKNCTFTSFTNVHLFSANGGSPFAGTAIFSSCDFVSSSYLVFPDATFGGTWVLRRCRIPSGWISGGYNRGSFSTNSPLVEMENCSSGTLSNPASGISLRSNIFGDSTESYSEYRTGGANNSDRDYSFNLTTNSNAKEFTNHIESASISKWVDSGSQTITVYIAGGSSLNDDDFWIEVESPSEEASPTAQGKFRTTKPDPLATPTALTSDTSSWTGTGVGTAQKVEVAISPTIAGTVTVRCYLAKPSTTVYVDPKISTDGYQRVFNGVLVDGDATASGGSATIHPLYAN